MALYRDAPRGDRFHTRARWWSAPFPAVETHVSAGGRILEVGCGHGLFAAYLALASPERSVTGVDIDPHKIEIALGAAERAGLGERLAFELVEPGQVLPGPWDTVVVADVLYLLSPQRRAELLAAYAASLAPGGALVVKEVDDRPRWKQAVVAVQERISTRVLRITAGEDLSLPSTAELAGLMGAAGLEVGTTRLDRGYPWPHALVVGRRTG